MSLIWRLALRNLFRNQRRSLTTGLAIAAGFIGLALLGAYILRAQRSLSASMVYTNLQGHLQIHKEGSLQKFSISPKKYLIDTELDQNIMRILQSKDFADKIELQGRFLTGSGLLVVESKSHPFLAQGFDRDLFYDVLRHPEVKKWASSWVKEKDLQVSLEQFQNHELISITPKLASIVGRSQSSIETHPELKSVQLITRSFYQDLNAVNAELGLFHSTGMALAEDTSLRMSLTLLQNLLATDGYQYRTLWLKNGDDYKKIKTQLQQKFLEQNLPLQVLSYTDEGIGDFFVGTMNFLYVMGAFFIVLICGMVGLSVVNSLTLGILERTKELGTLKALGFSDDYIVGLFVRETVWLSFFSLLAGFFISQIIARIVNAADLRITPAGIEGDIPFALIVDFQLYAVVCGGLLALAVVTAKLVASRKLKVSAISLLSEAGV